MASAGGDNARGAALLRATQAEVAEGIDALFDKLLAVPADPRGPLYEAMRYAALAGGSNVRIIHGKGTGALRQAIREYLDGHPLVESLAAGEGSGGDGVTVVALR